MTVGELSRRMSAQEAEEWMLAATSEGLSSERIEISLRRVVELLWVMLPADIRQDNPIRKLLPWSDQAPDKSVAKDLKGFFAGLRAISVPATRSGDGRRK